MAMTKKDYEAVAEMVAHVRYNSDNALNPIHQAALDQVVMMLAYYFQVDNARFDTSKFYSAAQFGKLPRESEVA